MNHIADFPGKLSIALKAISLSRVAAAQALGVDKSLVGRWLSGAVHPTEHNLSRLTACIAQRHAGFTLAHWDGSLEDFGARLGVPLPQKAADPGVMLPHLRPLVEIAREETGRRGRIYEGFFRTARPSLLVPDTIFHEYGYIRRNDVGLLDVAMCGSGLLFEGWALPAHGNLFVFLYDTVGLSPLSLVFRGVALPRAMVLDGLLLMAALDAGRTPAALPVLLERVGDLTGDDVADQATFEGMEAAQPQPLDPISGEAMRARLFRNSGPEVQARGFGDRALSVIPTDALSCGATTLGLRG